MAIPIGNLKDAATPVPSDDPGFPLLSPAKVVTSPLEFILRIQLLSASHTNTLPLVSTTKPLGLKNNALVPLPSTNPCADPASVVTLP